MYIWKSLFNKTNSIKQIMQNIIKQKHIDRTTLSDYLKCHVPTHDAYLLKNMRKALQKIKQAKNICIIGDYDADGVCATAIMYIGLKELARFYNFNINYIVPLRQDGYGLSVKTIDEAKEKNADLIITVDNGIAAIDQVNYAHSLNVDIVITDHHKAQIDPVSEEMLLPDCLIVDPQIDNYPFKFICGACVAFKLIEKLFEETLNDSKFNLSDFVDTDMLDKRLKEFTNINNGFINFNKKPIINLQIYNPNLYDELLALNAVATVADVMKISNENRYYVGIGLQKLKNCKNLGLRTLIKSVDLGGLNVDSISYTIGPIINAAGRMDTPYLALNLLLAEDII